MTSNEFERSKQTLKTNDYQKPTQLADLARQYWIEIQARQYNFKKYEMELKQLSALTIDELLNFFKVGVILLKKTKVDTASHFRIFFQWFKNCVLRKCSMYHPLIGGSLHFTLFRRAVTNRNQWPPQRLPKMYVNFPV